MTRPSRVPVHSLTFVERVANSQPTPTASVVCGPCNPAVAIWGRYSTAALKASGDGLSEILRG
jgi:hypothetical protein